jgi:hypothetical protein
MATFGLALRCTARLPCWWRIAFVLAWYRLIPARWAAELIARGVRADVLDAAE